MQSSLMGKRGRQENIVVPTHTVPPPSQTIAAPERGETILQVPENGDKAIGVLWRLPPV